MLYEHKNVSNARKLRKEMTPWERKLWHCFLKTYPIRFQRQKPIGRYIVDFYCAKAKLAIELDGGGHYDPAKMQEDVYRTVEIQKQDTRVLRFCNTDIDKNFYNVCTVIDNEVKNSLSRDENRDSSLREGAEATNYSQEDLACLTKQR